MRSHHTYLALGMTVSLLLLDAVGAWSLPSENRGVTIHRAPSTIDNTTHMDVNNLDMVVTNHGSFAYDLVTGNAGLIYPKGSTHTAVFAAGPWIGAKVNGEVRIAVGEYSQEFVPGPMLNGTFQPDNARFKNYKITRGNTTSYDYLNWPVQDGAPVDCTGKPALQGDAMIWSVYNDADLSVHNNDAGSTDPLGVEIQQSTFAFNRAGALGNIIFVRYKIINKGGNTLDSMFVSAWSDPDLGGFTDDLVGCDTTLSLGYVYNATNADGQYGSRPPAVGYGFFRGPIIPSGAPGVNDTLGMTSFNKYINGTDPHSSEETYNYMLGLHPDGSPVHVNDDPLQPITTFQVPGNPVTGTGWLDSDPADRRLMLTSGPFTMFPGDSQEVTIAVIVGQGTDRLSSISDLKSKDAVARLVFDLSFGSGVPSVLCAVVDLDPDVINLKTPAPWVTTYIEPSGFDPVSIDISTLRLAGSVPVAPKFATVGDHNRNGLPDLTVKYSREALDPLLTLGVNELEVTGSLVTGEEFKGSDEVQVINPPGTGLFASVAPNPLNPAGVLTFRTTAPGRVRVALFDFSGHLRRMLMVAPFLPAGRHEVAIDGFNEQGVRLASGVYFYRVEMPDGNASGSIVIMK